LPRWLERERWEQSRVISLLPISVILLLAAVTRAWGLTFGLPNSDVRPDETTTMAVALGLLFGGLNPRFFHWPSVEFYAVAAVYRLAFEVGHFRGLFHLKFDVYKDAMLNPTPYLLVPRVVSVVAGVVTVWLVYRVTQRLFDRATALVASFLTAVAYLHVRDSHFGVTDVPMTCLAVAAMLPLSRTFLDPSQIRNWIASGVVVGLAASTKYNGAAMVAVGLAIAAANGLGDRHLWPRRTVVKGAAAFLIAALVSFVAGTPFAVLDYPRFIEGLQFNSHHLATGHGIVLGRGWLYHLTFSLRYGLGTPLLIVAVAGMLVLTWQSWRKALVVCTFPVVYYLILGRGYTVFVRYMTPLVPFLCMTAAIAVVEIGRRVARWSPKSRGPAMAVVALSVALPSIGQVIAFDRLIARPDTRVLAADWLKPRMAPSDWIAETPPGILHPVWGRPPALRLGRFDGARSVFVSEDGTTVITPVWIGVATSPLSAYTSVPAEIISIIDSQYSLAATFSATRGPEQPTAFDQQDMFFVPYAEFTTRERPGPDIRIYRRLAAP
jgi:hypothetical protein